MPEQLVTVRSYNAFTEAELAQSVLDSAGIESFLCDVNVVRMNLFLANAVGGVKLQVREADAESARQIFEQAEKPAEELPRICPQCNSNRVRSPSQESSVQWLVLMVLSLLSPFRKRFECEDCGHVW